MRCREMTHDFFERAATQCCDNEKSLESEPERSRYPWSQFGDAYLIGHAEENCRSAGVRICALGGCVGGRALYIVGLLLFPLAMAMPIVARQAVIQQQDNCAYLDQVSQVPQTRRQNRVGGGLCLRLG